MSRHTAVLALGLSFALLAEPTLAEPITLTETGSTLIFPLFNIWASEYAKTRPGVEVKTAALKPQPSTTNGIRQALNAAGVDPRWGKPDNVAVETFASEYTRTHQTARIKLDQ